MNTFDAPRRSQPMIVVAEDDRDLRETLAELLAVEGLPVLGVSNGHLLVSCVAESLLHPERFGRIGLIIADVLMPGLSGIEAMARVRRCQVDTPLLLMTADSSPRIEHAAAAVGAAAILRKPFGYPQISDWVRRLVNAPKIMH